MINLTQFDTEALFLIYTDPTIRTIEAPVNANVWKVLVQEGQILEQTQTVVILEAMKMEINVNVEFALKGSVVVKILAKPGDSVEGGADMILVRLAESA